MANTTCLPIVPSPQSQAGYDCWQPCAGGLQHADDLVRHIRRRHGAHFSLGVVGFPEAHPESRAGAGAATEAERAEDVRRLKRKVDAGADFVICQFTFDAATWGSFLRRCRAEGIRVPILPGVQPLTEYASARLLASSWRVELPAEVGANLRALQGDAEGARACGAAFVAAVCDATLRQAAGSGEGLGLHVFVYDGEVETRALLEALAAQGWRRGQLPPAPPPAPSPARPPAAALAIAEGRRGSTQQLCISLGLRPTLGFRASL